MSGIQRQLFFYHNNLLSNLDLNLKVLILHYLQTFIAVDIPLNKLHNDSLVQFMKKYTGRKMPDPTLLRESYYRIHIVQLYSL